MNKPLFFTTRLIEDMEVLSNFYDVILVADVRLPLEFDEVSKVYPDLVKMHITRPELVSNLSATEQKHITEIALDEYKDYKYDLVNTTLEDLEEQAKKIVEEELK
jgi:hypothetical protein